MEQLNNASLKPATSYTRLDTAGKPYLQGSRCDVCQAVFLGEREHCGRCGTRSQMKSLALLGSGHLYNYTIVYRSYPGIKVPFICAVVDLDGGGTVKGNLLEVEPDPKHLHFGMPVRMVFREADIASPAGAGYIAHFFVPDGERSRD